MTRPSRNSRIFILVTAVVALWVQVPVAQVADVAMGAIPIGPATVATPLRRKSPPAGTAGAAALGPQRTLSVSGLGDTGAIPPSPGIAVGPNHVIQVVNRRYEIRDKTGSACCDGTLEQFPFAAFDLSGSKAPFDPAVIYDHFADRWAMFALSKDTASGSSYFLFAVSLTSDATGAWSAWRLGADQGNLFGTWADNGQLGFDNTNFYITANQYSFITGAFVQARVTLMGKNQFYTGNPQSFVDVTNMPDAPFALVPARTFGTPGVGYFVNAESATSGSALRIRSITGTWPNQTNTPPVMSVSTAVTVAAYTAPIDAASLGSTTPIDTGDARLLNVVYRGGFLYTAHTVGTPCFDPATSSCARFYKIAVGNPPTVSIEESVGTAELFSFYPAIEPDPSGNIFLVFSRTGPAQYAESRYALRLTTDSATQASGQLRFGSGPYNRLDGVINRWGTHGGAAVDPSDGTVWVTHQHAAGGNNQWGTWIARLSAALPAAFNRTAPANGATNQPVSVTLQWGASAGATGYEYCIDTTNDSACSDWIFYAGTSVLVSNLTPATTHYWHVRTSNANGATYANGSSTTYWSFTTGTLPAPFGKISPANNAAVAAGNVTLSWQPSTGATSYSYCFKIIGQGFCAFVSAGTNTSATVVAEPGKAYFWHVAAVNATGSILADAGISRTLTVSGPVNDWFTTAEVISTLPYKSVVDTFDATNTSEDPPMSCGAGPNKSVWYTYTPTINGPVSFDTFGSAYNTVLAVYTGSPGSFSQVLCSDDSYSTQMPQSSLTVMGFAGVRLSILVASYWPDEDGGGSLTLNAFRPTRRLEVDLNGNGQSDVLSYDPATGAWIRQLSQGGNGFSVQSQGTWDAGLSVSPGRFDTDGLTDFFLFNTTTGAWAVMLNNGTTFTKAAEGGWWPGWQRHIMDLNGDGVSDVFLYDPATGAWFMCERKPTGFNYFQGGWNPGWELFPMVLENSYNSTDDLFLFSRTTGRWFWAQSGGGGSFTYTVTEAWFSGWNLYPGDFNGDGRSDLLLHDPATGVYFVATNSGGGFTYTQGGWSLGWTPYVADFNADGREDLFLHDPQTGVWFEMMSDGAGHFTNGGGQIWSLGWRMTPTDLNGDRRVDMVLYDPATGTWYQARNFSNGSFAYTSGAWTPQLMLITRAPFR